MVSLFDPGAETAIPNMRIFGERKGVPLIRISPADPAKETGRLASIPLGALEALKGIEAALRIDGLRWHDYDIFATHSMGRARRRATCAGTA